MDIYTAAIDLFSSVLSPQLWPEMQALFTESALRKPRHWRLPVLACEAVGGEPLQAIPAVTAIGCLHISILLVDDMLDSDPRGKHHHLGMPVTANMAAAFQAVGFDIISQSGALPSIGYRALSSLNKMMLTTALGQHMDAQYPQNEESYWELVQTKSSPFFGAALYIGALLGGADLQTAVQIEKFGRLYGEMIQIHDDLNDTMDAPANPDWVQGRSPLPILFAQVVDHPDRERFFELHQAIADPDTLAEAQTILIRCGAVSYCIDQLLHRVQQAQRILEQVPFVSLEKLEGLLEDVVEPIRKLFAEIGLEQPETVFQPSEPVT